MSGSQCFEKGIGKQADRDNQYVSENFSEI
jgi:hypothetical protein